jgi:hypothetical protein
MCDGSSKMAYSTKPDNIVYAECLLGIHGFPLWSPDPFDQFPRIKPGDLLTFHRYVLRFTNRLRLTARSHLEKAMPVANLFTQKRPASIISKTLKLDEPISAGDVQKIKITTYE